MKPRDFAKAGPRPPYYKPETLASILGVSRQTFENWMRDVGVPPRRTGPNRRFVSYHWGTVHKKLTKAGCTNLPDLPFDPKDPPPRYPPAQKKKGRPGDKSPGAVKAPDPKQNGTAATQDEKTRKPNDKPPRASEKETSSDG